MKIKKLLKDLPEAQIKGSKEVEITGICINSKVIAPGNLFIAKKGLANDGSQYIQEAIEAGAVAIVTDMYDPSLKDITQIIHPNINFLESYLAAHYYQYPSNDLFIVGITGTNGKTTTSFLVKYLLDTLKSPCGLIGTIEYILGKNRYQATRTTPDVVSNHKMLREMVMQECLSAVMEVTSHALDQGRVNHIEFDVAIFTNLTLDHLDYHKSMENYAAVKSKLFTSLNTKAAPSKLAVVNVDNPWHAKMIEDCQAPILTYGIDQPADLRATEIHLSATGTTFKVTYKGKTVSCKTDMVGRFNVYNNLAAMAVGLARDEPLDVIAEIMKFAPPVSARLEPVTNELGLQIYVDFAHSDDALLNVLKSLHEFKEGRILTVFGCGGDRDKTKRAPMAKVSEKWSDLSIVTSDNPRSEDPDEIIRNVIVGFEKPENYVVEVDRYAAIEYAINLATPNDIVLIAGKGHEAYQIFAHKTIEFDDRKVAKQICQRKHLEENHER